MPTREELRQAAHASSDDELFDRLRRQGLTEQAAEVTREELMARGIDITKALVNELMPPPGATCEKCGVAVVPGSVHCPKCGHALGATEADPDRPLKRVFKWWLILYGFLRAKAVLQDAIAIYRSAEGSDAALYFSVLGALSALSFFALVMLWRGRRWALIVFVVAELAAGLWMLLFNQIFDAPFPVIAVAIMWYVSKRANFQRA